MNFMTKLNVRQWKNEHKRGGGANNADNDEDQLHLKSDC